MKYNRDVTLKFFFKQTDSYIKITLMPAWLNFWSSFSMVIKEEPKSIGLIA